MAENGDTQFLAISEMRNRISLLEARIQESGSTDLDLSALEELQTANEELRVAEEELRVQTEELERSRDRLEHERRRYRDLFDFAPDPYVITSPEGLIIEANQAA